MLHLNGKKVTDFGALALLDSLAVFRDIEKIFLDFGQKYSQW